jgi:hypothetical protein
MILSATSRPRGGFSIGEMQMKKARKIANTVADATLPKTPVTLDGKTYNLCLDFGALSEAETAINRELARAGSDQRVNLLAATVEENLANTGILFAAALRKYHPEISYKDALALINKENVFIVVFGIREAWNAAVSEKNSNPPKARPEK